MLKGFQVSFERRIKTNNIIHIRKNTVTDTMCSNNHGALQTPKGIRFETELASRSDECCPVDVLFCNGQLPERAEGIGSRDELDASYCIQTGIQVRNGPALADDMTVG